MNRFEPYLPLLKEGMLDLDRWRASFGSIRSEELSPEKLEALFFRFRERLKGNYPFHHPSYAGQMLKPPHPAAWLAYTLAMTINPNNHALDGGPPTSDMEKEVMAMLAAMTGYGDRFIGHLTSGGTIANLEALWVARELHPGKAIASSADAHYTHERMCRVLNTDHLTVPVLSPGLPDIDYLENHADEIGTLVVTLGTTALGSVEPLDELLDWASGHHIRVHADAAYGGFYAILSGTPWIEPAAWSALKRADSIVIDPHKHGLQPYGCGSVLYRDPEVGRIYRHDSPYTYFTSDDLHLGEISLECSRAGASAAALWLTLQLLPLTEEGLGRVLLSCRKAALELSGSLEDSSRFRVYTRPELDIVTYFPLSGSRTTSDVTRLSKNLFEKGMNEPEFPLWLSLCQVDAGMFSRLHPDIKADSKRVTIVRSVLMKPEHESYAGEILDRLERLSEGLS